MNPSSGIDRFTHVKSAVKEAAFVSPNGGMWSFAVSWLLSRFAYSPTGLAEGDDVYGFHPFS